ncbi:MAG TPA: DUF465 domain-containing protein [Casimicrobiaceae bacterium]|nr:DUF465 domain-containing protein [Casimicrobiaceae bacterium]
MANVVSLDPTGSDAQRVAMRQQIAQLTLEHRDLDDVIERLYLRNDFDWLQLTRLKRRKLLLKDQIAWLERKLRPDEPA